MDLHSLSPSTWARPTNYTSLGLCSLHGVGAKSHIGSLIDEIGHYRWFYRALTTTWLVLSEWKCRCDYHFPLVVTLTL